MTSPQSVKAPTIFEELPKIASFLPEVDLALLEADLPAIKRLPSIDDVYFELHKVCADRSFIHPQWGIMAGQIQLHSLYRRISVSALAQGGIPTFSQVTNRAKDILGKEYHQFVMTNAAELDAMVDYSYDRKFDSLAVSTLEKAYLLRLKINGSSHVIEVPQYMYMRIATFMWMNSSFEATPQSSKAGIDYELAMIRKVYRELATGQYSHASPTMFNCGTKRPQLSSCFLSQIPDTMTGISKAWKDKAIISMNSGGIGSDYSSLRHSEIGQRGSSKGILPWLKIDNEIMHTVDQGGQRPGSEAAYLCDWHIDVWEFVEARRKDGNDKMRARDLFYALWIHDEFMRRVKADEEWTLFCPNKATGLVHKYGVEFEMAYRTFEKRFSEGKLNGRRIRARDLWERILTTQIEEGMPYMLYADSVNRKSNQKNLGTVRCSNLCVHGDTYVLTSKGQIPISDLEHSAIKVWNGTEWSKVIVTKTNTHQDLLTVTLSNGVEIHCTPEHHFYIQESYWASSPKKVKARDLDEGTMLVKYTLPPAIEMKGGTFPHPYTHGFFCGDGTTQLSYDKQRRYPGVTLYGPKQDLLQYLEYSSCGDPRGDHLNVTLPKDLRPKFEVPHTASIRERLEWFAGYCDADGTIARNGTNESLQVASIEKDFLLEVRLMLQTLGIDSKVTLSHGDRKRLLPNGKGDYQYYQCKTGYRLLVSSCELYKLSEIGFNPHRLVFTPRKPARDAGHFVKVTSVGVGPKDQDTFCFNEPKQHKGMFNGVLTGQCTEIVEYVDEENLASCNLASLALPKALRNVADTPKEPSGLASPAERWILDRSLLEANTRQVVRNLNQVIDRNYYPRDVPEIKACNMRNRPLGIGVQGLADVFALLDIPWCIENEDGELKINPEAKRINLEIFETIYYAAVSESVEMAVERKNRLVAHRRQQDVRYRAAKIRRLKDRIRQYRSFQREVGQKGSEELIGELKINLRDVEEALKALEDNDPPGWYHTFPGSPTSRGHFQFDLWDREKMEKSCIAAIASGETVVASVTTQASIYDWDALRTRMIKYGMRNSLLVALMPTASSAQILGNMEAFEPFSGLIYARKVLSGQFMVINRHMVKDLKAIPMPGSSNATMFNTETVKAILKANGSLKYVEAPTNASDEMKARIAHLKLKYKLVWELPQEITLEMALDRGRYVCQTQSFNVFLEKPTFTSLNAYHFKSWEGGAKTGMYYLRTEANVEPLDFAVNAVNIPSSSLPSNGKRAPKRVVCTDEICVTCSS